jgi:hypothetical protein
MEVVRLKLTPDTVTPPAQRWDETTDEVQITPDGGATWYPDPALDPRTSSVYRQPARTGTDPKCDAAADMVATLQALINTAIDAIGTAQAANAILAIITVFTPGLGWLVRLVLAVVEAVLAIGSSVIDAAFTQAVYDDLLCIFYANIDANGQMSDAQLADIYADIAATQDTTVQAVFGYFSSLIGAVGWSNAGATGESVGDCAACVGCVEAVDYNFRTDEQGWAINLCANGAGSYVAASGWKAVVDGAGNRSLAVFGHMTECVTFNRIIIQFESSCAVNGILQLRDADCNLIQTLFSNALICGGNCPDVAYWTAYDGVEITTPNDFYWYVFIGHAGATDCNSIMHEFHVDVH